MREFDKCKCGQFDRPWHDCGDKPEGEILIQKSHYLELVALNAKLVAALEVEHRRSGHQQGWAEQCDTCALLREAAK